VTEEDLVLQMRDILSEGFDPQAAELANAVLALFNRKETLRKELEETAFENKTLSSPLNTDLGGNLSGQCKCHG